MDRIHAPAHGPPAGKTLLDDVAQYTTVAVEMIISILMSPIIAGARQCFS